MRAEIIIACRGELKKNLERTVDNIRNTISVDDGISVVMDGKQAVDYEIKALDGIRINQPWDTARGPGQARHWGIMNSNAEYTILIDGHMSFPAGWVDNIVEYLSIPANRKSIICCKMNSLGKDWSLLPDQQNYNGAYIGLKTHEDGNQYWALAAKWQQKTTQTATIPAIMGACYGMRKNWYKNMGTPLQILNAWGGDEEILSLASWLCGGEVRILPITVNHMYAAPYNRPEGKTSDEIADIWANRFAVLYVLPIPYKEKKQLLDWLRNNKVNQQLIKEKIGKREYQITKLRNHIKEQAKKNKRTWSWLKNHNIITYENKNDRSKRIKTDAARNQRKKKRIVQKATNVERICPLCGGRNTIIYLPPRPSSPSLKNAKCQKCGHKSYIKEFAINDK